MKKTITFVIPVYNEEKRIDKTFTALKEAKLPRGLSLEQIIFVNDGSRDKTLTVLKNFAKKNSKVKILSYAKNQGKGNAVKVGMMKARSDYNLFFDADMSTPLSELSKFMPFVRKNVQVIIGTRKNGHSTILVHQPKFREFLGRCFTKMTRFVLQVDVTDFTCGFKAFSKEATEVIFNDAYIKGWGYDAEIVFLAKKYKFSLSEKAVTWANDRDTKVKIYKAVPQTLLDLAKIYKQHVFAPAFANIKVNMNPTKLALRLSSFLA